MKFRHYQNEAMDATYEQWKQVRSTLIVMPTGTGKTVCIAGILQRVFPKRALVLAHREELIFQAKNKIEQMTGWNVGIEMGDLRADLPENHLFGGPQVVVSTIQTQTAGGDGLGRMSRFLPSQFGVVVIDECFPAGTLVDGRRIEEIHTGDSVTAFDHVLNRTETAPVLRAFKSIPSALCRVVLSDGRQIVCTPGHPFFVPEKSCYLPAITLTCRDVVLNTTERRKYEKEDVQGVREDIRVAVESRDVFRGMREESANRFSYSGRDDGVYGMQEARGVLGETRTRNGSEGSRVLLTGMFKGILRAPDFGDGGRHQSEVCLCANEGEQSHASCRRTRQGFDFAAGNGMEAAGSPRQRTDDASTATAGLCAGVGNGSGHSYGHQQGTGIPDGVQGGHRKCGLEDCRGGGRKQPPSSVPARGRQKEDDPLGTSRVARVEILERGSDGTFGGLCPDGFVYNLEVEQHHNYFANGVLVHNCHHSTAESYKRIIAYYSQNPDLKILGVTATPDRADEEALGQVYESVAYDYEILDAIHDGWLVPVDQRFVVVQGLDFSGVRTTAGDLNGADLADVMEEEKNLHGVVGPSLEIIGTRRTLVFAASVAQAERMSEVFNRHRPGCAAWICGKTQKDNRRAVLRDFSDGKLQVVCNVGVLTEGFDNPGVEVIIMARPTKSRSLYAQMAGRAIRPLDEIAHELNDLPTSEARRAMIASSRKPRCEIIDFVGNSGKHKLITTADLLGGKVSDRTIKKAVERAQKDDKAVRMDEALDAAETEVQAEEKAEAACRARLTARAKWEAQNIDPFDTFQIQPARDRGWDSGRKLTEKQLAFLKKQGIDATNMPFTQGRQLMTELFRRFDQKLCTFRQAKLLLKYNLPTNVTMAVASQLIDAVKASGWRRPANAEEIIAGASTKPRTPIFPIPTRPAQMAAAISTGTADDLPW